MYKTILFLCLLFSQAITALQAQQSITAYNLGFYEQAPCYEAAYNAPLHSILKVQNANAHIFVEVVAQPPADMSEMLGISNCAWGKLSGDYYSTKMTVQVSIQGQEGESIAASRSADVNNPYTLQTTALDYNPVFGEDAFRELNEGFDAINQNTALLNNTEVSYVKTMTINSSKPYVAYHKTLPTGTLVSIKNLSNGQLVSVEVIGQIDEIYPEAGISMYVPEGISSRIGGYGVFGELIKVELSYTLTDAPSLRKREHSKQINVESFQSKVIQKQALALHPSIAVGTNIYLQIPGKAETMLTVMGKPSGGSQYLQISEELYQDLALSKSQRYTIAYDEVRLFSNFEAFTNIFEDAVAVKEPNNAVKMGLWHKTLPIGTYVMLTRNILINDYGNTQSTGLFLEVVGKLPQAAEEDIRLSPDVWANLQKLPPHHNNEPNGYEQVEVGTKMGVSLAYFGL